MKYLNKLKQNNFQNNLWTLLASGITAVYINLLVFITVRTAQLAQSGILVFAATIVAFFHQFIICGVRAFQSTDIKQEYSLNNYIKLRIVSSLTATAVFVVFLLFSRFDTVSIIIVTLIFIMYFADGVADVFMGDLQQKGKMRIAGKMRVSAFGLSFISFAIISLITRTLILPLIVSSATTVVVYLFWIIKLKSSFSKIRLKVEIKDISGLLRKVAPILFGALIVTFLHNIQKYYLGFLDQPESVAVISFLMLPVTAVKLLCISFFSGAEQTKTAQVYALGDYKLLSRRIRSQVLLAVGVSAIFAVCSFTFGIPLLSWYYNKDLSAFSREFTFVTLGGVLIVGVHMFGAVLTVMRKQLVGLIRTVFIGAICAPIMWFVITRYGLLGASYSYLVVYAPLLVSSVIIYAVAIRRFKNEHKIK